MEKTRSQIEELDPLEGSVNRRDIFKKNLQSLESLEAKPSAEMESDEDSGYDVRSNSTSGELSIRECLATDWSTLIGRELP